MNGIFVKGPIFSRDSSKRLCVCVPGFVHCKRSNKHSLCSGIKQHKPPLRKALQSTYVIYFCHACNSSLRNKMKQVKDTETIQKHHFAVSEWLPSQASDVAGIFRLNVSLKNRNSSQEQALTNSEVKRSLDLNLTRHNPLFSEISSEHHLHIKKAANKVVDLQQSTWIRVLLRGELMRHFMALQSEPLSRSRFQTFPDWGSGCRKGR